MKIIQDNVFMFVSLVIVLLMFGAPDVPAQTVSKHHISWHAPQFLPVNEDEYIELLYFDKATYSDSLPSIPVFSVRKTLDVPFFNLNFAISEKVYEQADEHEDQLLREAGFADQGIRMQTALQSVRKQRYAVLSFYPFVYDPGKDSYKKLVSFTLTNEYVYDAALSYDPVQSFAENSVLATGSWYKLCVEETGVYRIAYEDLEAMGINPAALQKENIRLFGNGGGMLPEANSASVHHDLVENAVYVSGSSSGSFSATDYILFYGESADAWHFDHASGLYRYERHLYANQNCYFLTIDQGPGKRLQSQPSLDSPATHEINTFRDMAVHQRDLQNLIGSGRIWFGEVFDATLNRQFNFDIPNIVVGKQATVEAYLAARSSFPSSFTLRAGNQQKHLPIQAINPADYNGDFVRAVVDTLHFLPVSTSMVQLNLTYNRPSSGSRGWLNYLVINVSRHLSFTGAQMAFRNVEHLGSDHIHEYVLTTGAPQPAIWDVTDKFNVKQQEVVGGGNSLRFRLPGDQVREFIAFDGSGYLSPVIKGPIENQNLHALEAADLIIVSPEEFIAEARRLADFRTAQDDLSVQVVSIEEVYNEFSSGKPDVSAIRNFMKMFYDRAETPGDMPRYLLLFGNGTLDNRDVLGYGGNLIPTYQSLASFAARTSYMTDDYFGLLDDHEGQDAYGIPDVGIGRLPVRTVEEAAILVDKIIRYEQRIPGLAPDAGQLEYMGVIPNYADWRNVIVFIADDGDNNTHFNHAEILTNNITENYPQYNVQKIYLDAYQQVTMAGGARYPDVNRAINERVNQGALLINYIGHGGTRGLAHQRVLTFDDIAAWNNKYNMPVFMTATCQFSSFDQPDPEDLSAGVRIVLKPEGGTVALYTTTRLAWSGHNLTLNRHFMDAVFMKDDDGHNLRLGDLIRVAKKNSGNATTPMQLRNFVLLGDPSMRMAYPQYNVVTESMPDTIRAFQEVTVSGYVADRNGVMLSDYNGVLFPTVYDKKTIYSTLANNPDSHKDEFAMRDAILYRGKASVTDGTFSFSFVVPKDIAYDLGEGKISYYLDNGYVDGHGYYKGFAIGGTADSFMPDNQGPEIRLFMNDTTFVSGDHTHENPVLLALLSDDSGINLTGSIGRDIVAYMNGNVAELIRLNNYYQADLDTYKSGRIVYPFYRLEEGRYRLDLRAWDVHNNPASAYIEFVVSSKMQLILEDLMNYPNPFSGETRFVFKHNQAFSELDVRIDIYDLQGQLVSTIRERVYPVGFQSTPIRWDGTSNDGRMLRNGIYLYRLTMTAPDGQKARQSEKLMIVR
ncbi:MAG: type IX secretion system sortase PorU [Bacteroidales bacterium]|nr:type IX secretion system sortase PorU [Bacteroidales bacterium]